MKRSKKNILIFNNDLSPFLYMKIEFNIDVITISTIIILGLFAAIVLYPKKVNRLPNKILSFLLLAVSLWLMDAFMRVSGIYQQNPDAYFNPIYYSFAFGPLIYLYVYSLVNSSFQIKRIHLLHFIPVIIQAGLYVFLNFQNYSYKRWYWLEIHEPLTYRIEFDGTFISLAIYTFFSILLILRFQRRIKDNYSDIEKIRLNWLKIILIILLFLCAQWFVEVIMRDFYQNYYDFNYTTVILGILSLILAYGGITQINMGGLSFEESGEIKTYSKIEIDESLLEKIQNEMINNRAFLDPTLTLKSFANKCKTPSRKISEHINHGIKKSFHDYVNECRVKETQAQLKTADLNTFTLQSIAFECGFNSKASFNRIFKSNTGKTPSEYLKMIRKEIN